MPPGDLRRAPRRPHDEMHAAPEMHEAYRRHLGGEPGAALAGEEPAPVRWGESLHQAREGSTVDPVEQVGYLASHGQPRPGSGNLSRIH